MPYEYVLEAYNTYFPSIGDAGMDVERFDETYRTREEAETAAAQYSSEEGGGWTVDVWAKAYTQYVNIYLVDQGYGGPEEGGWYFTHGTPYASIPVLGKETIEEVVERYQPLVDQMNEGRYSISSVLSEGVYQIHREHHQARAYPEQQPHYE